eukprot:1139059-Pelagomonas_calceolata.AAC.3
MERTVGRTVGLTVPNSINYWAFQQRALVRLQRRLALYFDVPVILQGRPRTDLHLPRQHFKSAGPHTSCKKEDGGDLEFNLGVAGREPACYQTRSCWAEGMTGQVDRCRTHIDGCLLAVFLQRCPCLRSSPVCHQSHGLDLALRHALQHLQAFGHIRSIVTLLALSRKCHEAISITRPLHGSEVYAWHRRCTNAVGGRAGTFCIEDGEKDDGLIVWLPCP